MNSAFREAANQARQKPVYLTQNQKAARLYRKSLKTLLSWCIDREIFNDEATEIRAQFDATRGMSASASERILKEGQDKLFEYTHPDPYCVPFMPGGTLFMRNPPPPLEVCFPDGNYPADAPKVTLNPDMTICRPETGKSAVGSVLIDFGKKSME
jgi:NADH dehydrogenase (ubiquinone) 1 beta subcomplex subunit 9